MRAKLRLGAALGLAIGVAGVSSSALAERIDVRIGHQSMCTDTYTAGIVLKELNLIAKYLPHDGKYKDAEYVFDWKDYTSGPPITNMMLANKLDFGVMGDYPLIVNGAKFQETQSLRSLYVAGTAYNLRGSGNAIVVPADSDIDSLKDLRGKALSMPVGSAAWGMTLKALQDAGIKSSELVIKNQSPPVGAANIAQKKIDAHADFCPWSEIMEFRGTGRKIFDGGETDVPYLHGMVVRKDYAEKYPEVVVAVIKAIIEAGNWIQQDPQRAAEMLEKWTGVEKEVQYLYFSKGGHLTLDPTIKPKWVEALKYDHSVLAKEKQIPPLNFKEWIDDRFVRQAYKELGLDYEKQLALIREPKRENKSLPPAELWHATKGVISYPSVAAMLADYDHWQQTGQKVNATYVYDQVTGLKLFATVAFYARKPDGDLMAFMRMSDADKLATSEGGAVMKFAEAVSAIAAKASKEASPTGPALKTATAQ